MKEIQNIEGIGSRDDTRIALKEVHETIMVIKLTKKVDVSVVHAADHDDHITPSHRIDREVESTRENRNIVLNHLTNGKKNIRKISIEDEFCKKLIAKSFFILDRYISCTVIICRNEAKEMKLFQIERFFYRNRLHYLQYTIRYFM